MSPNTPHFALRLSQTDKARLEGVARAMRTSMTEAIRHSVAAMEGLAVYVELHEPRMCPLGEGHTEHVWELSPGPSRTGGTYFCAGQPFANGYDPYDSPKVQRILRAFAFQSRGLQPCCGATNPPCDSENPVMESTGCETCGHPEGCHPCR